MPTNFIIIRHGETDWNLRRRYCGFRNVALNDNGRTQAKRLYTHIRAKKIRVDKVYSSDRRRALETARIAFRYPKMEVFAELREMNFGIFEGLTHEEILARHGKIYSEWLKNPYKVNIPKGESMGRFKKRVVHAFKKILKANVGKTVAIVCHGGVISVYLNHIMKTDDFWKTIPSSASLAMVKFTKCSKPAVKMLKVRNRRK